MGSWEGSKSGLYAFMLAKAQRTVILGGDFSCIENPQWDKNGGHPDAGTGGAEKFRRLRELVDTFRILRPNVKQVSWSRPDGSVEMHATWPIQGITSNKQIKQWG